MFIELEKTTPKMTALAKLKLVNDNNKFVCVGLDTDLKKIPEFIRDEKDAVYQFNKKIIDSTKEYAAAYKINFAFYEVFGAYGFEIIQKTLSEIPSDILIIADAKRGDIGNTSEMYASSIFEHFKFDSVTLNPYMGYDSIEPFLKYSDKLNFILALTSNSGAIDIEKVELKNGKKLYEHVIRKIIEWNSLNQNCGIVFGATNLEELKENMSSFGGLPVLLPGVGAQGGSFENVLRVFNSNGRKNFLINLSRSILYLDSSENFAKSAELEVVRLNDLANRIFND